MTWADGTLVSFDIESTGVNPEEDRIVTASVVVIDGTTGHYDTHEWLIDPGVDIPASATEIHGITTEHARENGKSPEDAIPNIFSTLCAALARGPYLPHGATLVVYNAPYDLTMLDREICRHVGSAFGLTTAPKVVDPLVLDRALDKYRKGSRKLIDVSRHYGVPIAEKDAHGSTSDALCAARVAWKIGKDPRYASTVADLVALQQFQRDAYRDWAEGFATYLRGKGQSTDDVTTDWPYRPRTETLA